MIVNRTYKIVLFLVCSLCFGICHAQYSFKGVLNPVVTVQTVLNIELTNNVSSTVNFTSTSQFSDGVSIPNFATVQIKSNMPWAFGVSTATPYFSASGSYSTPNMPSQVLGMRLSTQTQYQQLTTTSKTLTTGNRGNSSVAGNTFNLSLFADPKYEYGPGIYSITINYILTAQ
jgi:hypothetical protein